MAKMSRWFLHFSMGCPSYRNNETTRIYCEGRCQVGDHIKSMLSWGEADNAIDIGRKVSHPHWLKSDGKLFWGEFCWRYRTWKDETLEDVVYNFGHGMFFLNEIPILSNKMLRFYGQLVVVCCWGMASFIPLGDLEFRQNASWWSTRWPHQTCWTRNPEKLGKLGGGNSNIFYFHPENLGRFPILTNIFQVGWNHQPGNDQIWRA